MRARDRGRAFGQIVALGAALAVFCAAADVSIRTRARDRRRFLVRAYEDSLHLPGQAP